jgi:hypothetical protein
MHHLLNHEGKQSDGKRFITAAVVIDLLLQTEASNAEPSAGD